MTNVTILGAGAGGYTYAADLTLLGHTVTLFEFPQLKDNIKPVIEAGGIEILSDHKRKADKSNPKGYYELSAVKHLAKDNSCIKEAPGKAVKVISQLLEYLPNEYQYKVIFMLRSIEEIIKSQQKMLGKQDSEEEIAIFKKVFERDRKTYYRNI